MAKHANKFKPEVGTFYPKGNDICAYCLPAFPESLIPAFKLDEIKTTKHTIAEWSSIFQDFADASANASGDTDIGLKLNFDPKVPLKTPAKRSTTEDNSNGFFYYTPSGLKSILHQTNFCNEDMDEWLADPPITLPPALVIFVRNVRSFLMDYEQWWKTPISEIFDALSITKEDLHLLKKTCEKLHLAIGTPSAIDGMDFPDLWSAIDYLGSLKSRNSNVDLNQLRDDITLLKDAWDHLPATLTDFLVETDLAPIRDTLDKFDHRFQVISPLLQQIKVVPRDVKLLASKLPGTSTPAAQTRASPLFGRSNVNHPHFLPEITDDTIARLASIELKLTTLERRVIGNGVSIGSFHFQALEEVRLWCETHLPTKCFGLLLDAVSVFEFLAQDHTDTAEVLTNLYNSQKNQFSNMYDSKVLSSCQKLFPTIFGRSTSDGLDMSRTLPGLSTPEK